MRSYGLIHNRLLHENAPKVDMPVELRTRIERMKKEAGK